jgi:hypothetical protein
MKRSRTSEVEGKERADIVDIGSSSQDTVERYIRANEQLDLPISVDTFGPILRSINMENSTSRKALQGFYPSASLDALA